jgi:hypothetical protein
MDFAQPYFDPIWSITERISVVWTSIAMPYPCEEVPGGLADAPRPAINAP